MQAPDIAEQVSEEAKLASAESGARNGVTPAIVTAAILATSREVPNIRTDLARCNNWYPDRDQLVALGTVGGNQQAYGWKDRQYSMPSWHGSLLAGAARLRYGSSKRSFRVPDGVDADRIEANFKNGVLTVTRAKSAEAQKATKKITVKAA
jgi:Hsp20/alpha crystallin family